MAKKVLSVQTHALPFIGDLPNQSQSIICEKEKMKGELHPAGVTLVSKSGRHYLIPYANIRVCELEPEAQGEEPKPVIKGK